MKWIFEVRRREQTVQHVIEGVSCFDAMQQFMKKHGFEPGSELVIKYDTLSEFREKLFEAVSLLLQTAEAYEDLDEQSKDQIAVTYPPGLPSLSLLARTLDELHQNLYPAART